LAYPLLKEERTGKRRQKMRVTYLKSRQCPHCGAKVVVMLLRYSATMSSISGICRRCDHGMKWLMLEGKAAVAARERARRIVLGPVELGNDQAAKSR
jgi:hypothetical protein